MSEPIFNSDVDDALREQPQGIRATTQELRKLVLHTLPEAEEQLKWGMPCYRLNRLVCYLKPRREYVTFGFYEGTALSDPAGVLEGTGETMRHVKIAHPNEIKPDVLVPLILEAARHDEESYG